MDQELTKVQSWYSHLKSWILRCHITCLVNPACSSCQQEKAEDIKLVFRSRQSRKTRQYNGPKERDKRKTVIYKTHTKTSIRKWTYPTSIKHELTAKQMKVGTNQTSLQTTHKELKRTINLTTWTTRTPQRQVKRWERTQVTGSVGSSYSTCGTRKMVWYRYPRWLEQIEL